MLAPQDRDMDPESSEHLFRFPHRSQLIGVMIGAAIPLPVVVAALANAGWGAAAGLAPCFALLALVIVGARRVGVVVSERRVRMSWMFTAHEWATSDVDHFDTDAAWTGAPLRFSTVILVLRNGEQRQLIGPRVWGRDENRRLVAEMAARMNAAAGIDRVELTQWS